MKTTKPSHLFEGPHSSLKKTFDEVTKPNTNMEWEDKVIIEILKHSEGHLITYEYTDEDGSLKDDKAIPVGWFKEWLRVAIRKAISQKDQETKEALERQRGIDANIALTLNRETSYAGSEYDKGFSDCARAASEAILENQTESK